MKKEAKPWEGDHELASGFPVEFTNGLCWEMDETGYHRIVGPVGRKGKWANYRDIAMSDCGRFIVVTDYFSNSMTPGVLFAVDPVTVVPKNEPKGARGKCCIAIVVVSLDKKIWAWGANESDAIAKCISNFRHEKGPGRAVIRVDLFECLDQGAVVDENGFIICEGAIKHLGQRVVTA